MRVVSLCPSVTETVFALGAGDALVGVTRYCAHPAEGLAAIERVGGTKDPDVARITALAPDLVLMNDEENRRADWEALRAAGLRCLSTFPRDVAGAADMARALGEALGRGEAGRALAREIGARAEAARRAASRRPRVRFAYLVWRKPWMAAGADTYVDALLGLAGGENVLAARGERYPRVEVAELAAADPERVLLSSEPFPFRAAHADELAAASGLPRGRFRCVDGELTSWYGARTPAGIAYAERCLHGAPEGGRPERP